MSKALTGKRTCGGTTQEADSIAVGSYVLRTEPLPKEGRNVTPDLSGHICRHNSLAESAWSSPTYTGPVNCQHQLLKEGDEEAVSRAHMRLLKQRAQVKVPRGKT